MLSIVPKQGVVCEVGVYRGDFAASILDACEPQEMVLIDAWPDREISTGDQDGLNLIKFNGRYLHQFVRDRFADSPQVRLVQGLSHVALDAFPGDYFDMVYIDADHSEEAVARDLEIALRKVKPGGFIMGHDYLTNPSINPIKWDRFGVKRAVDPFCEATGHEIAAMAYDGCTSFAIQVKK